MVPPGKEERLRKGARDILCRAARHRRWLPVRVLAGFAGLAQSVQLALPLARLYLRAIFDVIKTKHSWESDVRLTKQALRDLAWWTELSTRWTERAIFREATTATLYSDASMRGWGGVLNNSTGNVSATGCGPRRSAPSSTSRR